MAEERYGTRYTRTEKNVMWTIAFVILLLVLIFWGLWYFNRPAATTTETAADAGVATEGVGTSAPISTETTTGTGTGAESAGTTGGAATGGEATGTTY